MEVQDLSLYLYRESPRSIIVRIYVVAHRSMMLKECINLKLVWIAVCSLFILC